MAFRKWVWVPTLISGESMLPTLRSSQLAGVNKLGYRFDQLRRGDVVGGGVMTRFLQACNKPAAWEVIRHRYGILA